MGVQKLIKRQFFGRKRIIYRVEANSFYGGKEGKG